MQTVQISNQTKKIGTYFGKAALLLLPPLSAFWLMQFILGAMPWEMGVGITLANTACLAGLYWLACAISGYPAICCIVLHAAAGLWGAANYFVSVFRGTPILPWDFTALGTAAAVAGSYRYTLTWQMAAAMAIMALLIWGLRHQIRGGTFRPSRRSLPLRLGGLLLGGLCLFPVLQPQCLAVFGVETDVWDQTGAYRNGGAVAVFLRNTEFMQVTPPEDTTAERVSAIVEGADEVPSAAVNVEHPNIIAIMNESWADFESFGNLSLSESLTDYIDSLDNTIRGKAYASVFGAGTSASEFEFLTGNSMAFLPSGSIPYQQYVLGPTDSMASLLRENGYETRAFHPGARTSWQRNIAYPRLGFDTFKCREDMDVPQTEEHGYVSDASDFAQLIWELEHKEEGKPLFLFNVTIQNHGSYTVEDYPAEVTLTDEPGIYPMAEQYLTLANKTDEAFAQLISYLEQMEEPTLVVMFGDHQPSVEQAFLDKAYGVTQSEMTMEQYMGKFQVPFVIWANYPLPQEGPEITSLNFLGQHVLRYAGIESSLYGNFLWQMQESVPALSFPGYWDTQGKAYSHLESNGYTEWIQDYERVQYNNLFGGEERQDALFGRRQSDG